MQAINQGTKFKGEILSKVYRVWFLRKFLPVFFAEIFVLSLVLYQFTRVIFIQKVLENIIKTAFQSPTGAFFFLWSAFGKTHTSTKILSVALIVLLALLLRLITQGILRWILIRKNYFGKAGFNGS